MAEVQPAVEPVTLYYPDMAPVLYLPPGADGPAGIVADRVNDLVGMAGLNVRWVGPEPRQRILVLLGSGEAACAPNLIRTPERAAQFNFSAPIFPERRWNVIVRDGEAWSRDMPSLKALLADPTHLLGHLHGAALGAALDGMLAEAQARRQAFRGTPADLLNALMMKRVDYILADFKDEADLNNVLAKLNLPTGRLRLLDFADMPRQEPGRIMCSRAVPTRVIDAFNRAIAGSEVADGGR